MLYTLAVTSCNRHDLLKRTLESFVATCNVQPRWTVILEDSSAQRPTWLDDLFPRLGIVKWVNNYRRMGQSYAIDRLYAELQTEYIFWCEDDWEFTEGGYMNRSHQILFQNPDISMVALRSDWNHPLVEDPKQRGFKIAEPYWGGCWGGTCWNPGLRRLSDYRRFGSYGRHVGYGESGLLHEKRWSTIHLDAGYRIAALPHHCHHIGAGRSRAIEALDVYIPKVLIAVPACRKFDYGRWESEESPHYDRAKQDKPYGTDIHISHRENDRIAAVRDTWWKDIEGWTRVDGRFFYGSPQNAPLAPDEVQLTVPDDYAHLPHKTQAICRYAFQKGYDFLFKCDDDTAVYVERLVLEILQRPNLLYGGCAAGEVCTGGPGYILGRRAMEIVANAGDPDFWAEDVWVSIVLGRNGIMAENLKTHLPGYAAHWYWPDKFNPEKLAADTVSVHAVQPEMMRTWYRERDK